MSKKDFEKIEDFTAEEKRFLDLYNERDFYYLPTDSDERFTLSGETILKLLDNNHAEQYNN
jgi:hypothetical protein